MKRQSRQLTQNGNALLIALGVLMVLSLIAGVTLNGVSRRYKTALRTAAWEESLLAAESGVDTVVAQLSGLLPNVSLSNNGVSVAPPTPSLALVNGLVLQPGGLNLANGVSIGLTMPPLTHGGEGANTSTASVTLDVLPLDQALNGQLVNNLVGLLSGNQAASINLLRVHSIGTVYLPSSSREAEVSKLDANLLRLALMHDPNSGNKVTQPFVSRQIEVLLKPVFPFENGVATEGAIDAPNSATIFDSFNSSSPLSSTNGLYDSTKRRSNISVSTNGPSLTFGGTIYGNASTDGGNVAKNSQVTGTVSNSYFRPLPTVNAPAWSGISTSVNGSKTVAAGSLLSPTQYQYSQVTGTLHVTPNLVGGLLGQLGPVPVVGSVVSSEADIYVSGDFNGTIIVDPGVKARVYVQGNVTFASGGVQNNSLRASELQIIGVPPSDGTTRTITMDTSNNPVAAIYAPTHNVTITGGGDFSGAISAAQLSIHGNAAVHFDEELTLEPGLVLGYELVSWQEVQASNP